MEGKQVIKLLAGQAVAHESSSALNKGHVEWHISRWQVRSNTREARWMRNFFLL